MVLKSQVHINVIYIFTWQKKCTLADIKACNLLFRNNTIFYKTPKICLVHLKECALFQSVYSYREKIKGFWAREENQRRVKGKNMSEQYGREENKGKGRKSKMIRLDKR